MESVCTPCLLASLFVLGVALPNPDIANKAPAPPDIPHFGQPFDQPPKSPEHEAPDGLSGQQPQDQKLHFQSYAESKENQDGQSPDHKFPGQRDGQAHGQFASHGHANGPGNGQFPGHAGGQGHGQFPGHAGGQGHGQFPGHAGGQGHGQFPGHAGEQGHGQFPGHAGGQGQGQFPGHAGGQGQGQFPGHAGGQGHGQFPGHAGGQGHGQFPGHAGGQGHGQFPGHAGGQGHEQFPGHAGGQGHGQFPGHAGGQAHDKHPSDYSDHGHNEYEDPHAHHPPAMPHTQVIIEVIFRPSECGRQPKLGDNVKIHYTGTLESNGKKFDSSYDRNQPLEFQVGSGQVVQGLENGIMGMCTKEKRVLTIPPHLAFGPRGTEKIPPFSTVKYEVELQEVKDGETAPNVFKEIDADGDKRVSPEELTEYLKKQAEKHGMTEEKLGIRRAQMVQEIFMHEDKDKDGYISFNEFSGPKHDEL